MQMSADREAEFSAKGGPASYFPYGTRNEYQYLISSPNLCSTFILCCYCWARIAWFVHRVLMFMAGR